MQFTIMLNRDIPMNRLMNALAQMSFGLGHRINGEPNINIFFGNTDEIRAFRTLSSKLASMQPKTALCSDFPHTMVGMSTDTLLATVVSTPEADITYYGACYLAEQYDEQLNQLTQTCLQLNGYEPHVSKDKAQLLPAPICEAVDKPKTDKKITMLLNKFPLQRILNEAVLANLIAGNRAPYQDQYLLNIGIAEGGSYRLTNISFHSNIIAKTDLAKHSEMAQCAEKTDHLISVTRYSQKDPLVTVVFGDQALVESVIKKTQTRLFGDTLGKNALVPVKAAEAEKKIGFFKGTDSEAIDIKSSDTTQESLLKI